MFNLVERSKLFIFIYSAVKIYLKKMAVEFAGLTRSLSRKRIAVSNNAAISVSDSDSMAPLKRMCNGKFNINSTRSRLEDLPQEILVSRKFFFIFSLNLVEILF